MTSWSRQDPHPPGKNSDKLSRSGPKPLFPIPPRRNPNPVQPSSKHKLVPKELGLTLKSVEKNQCRKDHIQVSHVDKTMVEQSSTVPY